jgi:hypothetical protein
MKECDRCTAAHVVVVDYTLHLCGRCYLHEMLMRRPAPIATRVQHKAAA